MSTGYLKVQTRTNNDTLPVSGARVIITNNSGNKLHDLLTDQDGQTEYVPLEAVDSNLSLDSNSSGSPFTTYNVQVSANGFDTVMVFGAQIFDGIRSTQPVTMLPMTADKTCTEVLGVTIEDNALHTASQRIQTGTGSNSRVLRQVIIPEEITVHMGTPESNAQNITVSFLNYIKNVASSEIYPTWPQAALQANIHAQITFTLNRIFTEWYRSQGYNFDITSSTAYDQNFVYGQTIHDNISNIVDEIFNQYVRRQGDTAPYFTSFCNGTTATCSGLSQWGTVDLANKGLDALEILRSYYPNEVEITESNIIANVYESYPETALREGDSGRDVETIQHWLSRIRENYPGITAINDESGNFGSDTADVVRAFQGVFNLSVDGVVGRATWYKTSYIYISVTKLANLDSEGTELGIGTIPPNVVLSQGSSGLDVTTLQYMLNYISDFYPSVPEVVQNGIFGDSTKDAVIAFQQLMGLTADGIVGPNTWRELYQTYWGIRNNTIPPEGEEESEGVTEYTVQARDTLTKIANQFGTTVEELMALNGLTDDLIYIGQILQIPATANPTISYTVQASDTLATIASQFGTTLEALMELNGLTSDLIYAGQVLQIPTNEMQIPANTYTVEAGDSLFKIANQFGTTVEELMELNGLTDDLIYIGQVMQIPTSETQAPMNTYTVQAGDTLSIIASQFGTSVEALMELNGLSSDLICIGQVLQIPTSETQVPMNTYTVQAGDTLSIIASQFGTSVEALMELNGLTDDLIYIGQVLQIPTSEMQAPMNTYTVQPGDTLSIIASQFGTSVEALMELNGLTDDLIYIGQVLQIPTSETQAPTNTYTVQAGDTLSIIASQFGTTVEALMGLNGLTSDLIYIGQVLQIPTNETQAPANSYTVQAGDTLSIIASQFGTTVEALMELNGLTSDLIYIGQVLQIPTSETQAPTNTYTVEAGDSLFKIANRFGTTIEEIKKINCLTVDLLNIGQILIIPESSSEVSKFTYVVQAGDTLSAIAKRFQTTVDSIVGMNGLTSDLIFIGQELQILGVPSTGENAPASFIYSTQTGDTLTSIANRFGTTAEAIMELNGLSSNVVFAGRELQIPGYAATYTVQSGDSLSSIANMFGTTVSKIKEANNLAGDIIIVGQVFLIPQ